jgi:hypothetical protein
VIPVTASSIELILFMKIYVTLMPGVIWTPLLLIQPVHGYNELTLTSIPFVSFCDFHHRFINRINSFYENLRDADTWSHLDSITSHPTGSRLQRVDININSFRYDYEVADYEVAE